MSGFDIKRFTDLSERETKYLCCGICLNIFNNAVDSLCGHTFCKQCIQRWIQSNHKKCPECRQEFRRKRPNETTNNDNSLIIDGKVFARNLIANALVSEMKIKCNFEANGCKEIIQLGSLAQHILNCEHKFCQICGLTDCSRDDHNCLQLMTNDRNLWKIKFNKLTKYIKEAKIFREKDVCVYEDVLRIAWNRFSINDYIVSDRVFFGTHRIPLLVIDINAVGVWFEPQTKHYFNVDFEMIDELMYCSDPTLNLLIIKCKPLVCKGIRKVINLLDKAFGWFDVESEDPSQRYLIIDFKSQTLSTDYWMTLKYYSYSNNKDLNCEAIHKTRAEEFLQRALI